MISEWSPLVVERGVKEISSAWHTLSFGAEAFERIPLRTRRCHIAGFVLHGWKRAVGGRTCSWPIPATSVPALALLDGPTEHFETLAPGPVTASEANWDVGRRAQQGDRAAAVMAAVEAWYVAQGWTDVSALLSPLLTSRSPETRLSCMSR